MCQVTSSRWCALCMLTLCVKEFLRFFNRTHAMFYDVSHGRPCKKKQQENMSSYSPPSSGWGDKRALPVSKSMNVNRESGDLSGLEWGILTFVDWGMTTPCDGKAMYSFLWSEAYSPSLFIIAVFRQGANCRYFQSRAVDGSKILLTSWIW